MRTARLVPTQLAVFSLATYNLSQSYPAEKPAGFAATVWCVDRSYAQ
jgi:hypothetical protein